MRIREPKTTALIFASGKMVVTGAKSEDDSKLASRKYARIIQKLGFNAKFTDFKIQNIVGSCDIKFPIRLEGLASRHHHFSSYEPELFPGLIYRMIKPKIVLLIFVSGKIVLTGAKVREEIYQAFEMIYPVLSGEAARESSAIPSRANLSARLSQVLIGARRARSVALWSAAVTPPPTTLYHHASRPDLIFSLCTTRQRCSSARPLCLPASGCSPALRPSLSGSIVELASLAAFQFWTDPRSSLAPVLIIEHWHGVLLRLVGVFLGASLTPTLLGRTDHAWGRYASHPARFIPSRWHARWTIDPSNSRWTFASTDIRAGLDATKESLKHITIALAGKGRKEIEWNGMED